MNNLLSVILLIIFCGCFPKNKCNDVNVILPENYSKNFIIIFYNQQDGADEEWGENESEIFRIPDSGILYTKAPIQLNCMYKQKTFLLKNGNLQLIRNFAIAKYNGGKIHLDSLYTFSGYFTDKENFGFDSKYYFIGTQNEIQGENGIIKPNEKVNEIMDSIILDKGWELKIPFSIKGRRELKY